MAPTASLLFALAAAALMTTSLTHALTTSLTHAAAAPSFPPPPHTTVPPPPPPPCHTPPPSAVAFLRARCAATLYPVACYETLFDAACTFRTNPVKLARGAADVNAAWLRGLSGRVKGLAARGTEAGAGAAALRDCASTLASAAGLAKQSAAEVAKLDAAGAAAGTSQQVRWSVSNAQAWLSASMTNEASCADGILAAGPAVSPETRDLVVLVVSIKEHTSIALTLVTGLLVPS